MAWGRVWLLGGVAGLVGFVLGMLAGSALGLPPALAGLACGAALGPGTALVTRRGFAVGGGRPARGPLTRS